MIANHGRIEKYDHEFEGRNSRLDAIQAAILDVKLRYLDQWIEQRRRVADYYLQELNNVSDLILPLPASWASHVWHLFVIRTPDRDNLKRFLSERGIETGIHYPFALPKLRAYSHLHQQSERMQANEFDSMLLSLPIGEHLTDEDLRFIVASVREFFACE